MVNHRAKRDVEIGLVKCNRRRLGMVESDGQKLWPFGPFFYFMAWQGALFQDSVKAPRQTAVEPKNQAVQSCVREIASIT